MGLVTLVPVNWNVIRRVDPAIVVTAATLAVIAGPMVAGARLTVT